MSAQIIAVDVFDLVVFGGTGDLARRKLMPGLFYRDLDNQAPAESRIIGNVAAIAADRGVPMAEVAMAWLLLRPGVTAPIIGVSKPRHLDDAVAALSFALDDDEIQRLEADYLPLPVRGHR